MGYTVVPGPLERFKMNNNSLIDLLQFTHLRFVSPKPQTLVHIFK